MWGAVECRKALFLKRLSRKEEAVESVLLSIKGYPWNWSAWLLLASCLGDRDEVSLEIKIESVLFSSRLEEVTDYFLPFSPSFYKIK